METTSRRPHPLQLPSRASKELPYRFLVLPRHHRPEANSSPLKPGRRPTTLRPEMPLAKKMLRPARKIASASRNTAALSLGYSDTGRAVTEEALECRRLQSSRKMAAKTLLGQPHLCMLPHRELIPLRQMRDHPSVQGLLARLRLLLRIGTISLGRVGVCCHI